jgi:isocitrate/isopropylmalate dehydrogenase
LTPAWSPRTWVLPTERPLPERPVLTVIGGDGIGPEVTEAAVECLEATGVPFELRSPVHGERAEVELGTGFPESVKEAIDAADGILVGAVQKKSRAILRYIRYQLESYANLRPSASLPGVPAVTGGGRTQLVIVRELTEGMYPGREGDLSEFRRRWPEFRDALDRPLPDHDGKFALRITTRRAVLRIAEYAARLAVHRKEYAQTPGHVTVVHKANVLPQTDLLFLETCREVLERFPQLTVDDLYVDEAARRLVARPESFDVIVTSNLFGDILSDVAAETMGGLPMAPSAGIGAGQAYFEPCHGSAPDIAGRGIANPAAAIGSAAMLLAHWGHFEASDRLMHALLTAMTIQMPVDLGGKAGTRELVRAVLAELER